MPLISVIVSNFNGARFLPRLLATLRDQREVSAEIIIVDRRSTDDSGASHAAKLAASRVAMVCWPAQRRNGRPSIPDLMRKRKPALPTVVTSTK